MIARYFSEVQRLLTQVLNTQAMAMEKAACAVADALAGGGTVFTFGTGHSHMLAEEIFYRAGGLVKVYPLLDEPLMLHVNASRSSHMERLTNYAQTLLEDGPVIRQGDVLFIFSNSGRNAVPVDMAEAARARGMRNCFVVSHADGTNGYLALGAECNKNNGYDVRGAAHWYGIPECCTDSEATVLRAFEDMAEQIFR